MKDLGGALFECEAGALLAALGTVKLVTPRRPARPILGAVLLEGEGETVVVTGTDGETFVSVRVPARSASGRVAFPHHELTRLLSSGLRGVLGGKASVVTIAPNDLGRWQVAVGGRREPADTYPGDAFPMVPSDLTMVGNAARADLVAGIRRVLTGVLRDDARPDLCGASVEVGTGRVTFAGGDVHRLGVARIAACTGLIQRRHRARLGAPALVGIVGRLDGARVAIQWGESDGAAVVGLIGDTVRVVTRGGEEAFPEYEQYLGLAPGAVVVAREELLREVRCSTPSAVAKCRGRPMLEVRVSEASMSVRPVLAERSDEVVVPDVAAEVCELDEEHGRFWVHAADFQAALEACGDARVALRVAGPAAVMTIVDGGSLKGEPEFREVMYAQRKPRHLEP